MRKNGKTNGIEWESEAYADGDAICVSTRSPHGDLDVEYVSRDRACALVAALRAAMEPEPQPVGYRVRVICGGPTSYAYLAPDSDGGWDPTNKGDPKPQPLSRADAVFLLRLCRAWSERIRDSWTYRLVRVTRAATDAHGSGRGVAG